MTINYAKQIISERSEDRLRKANYNLIQTRHESYKNYIK